MEIESRTTFLYGLLGRRLSREKRAWLGNTLAVCRSLFQQNDFLDSFSTAGRRLGRLPLSLVAEEESKLARHGIRCPLGGWGIDELGRSLLLLNASLRLSECEFVRLVETCYRRGEGRERQAVLRALSFLPKPESLLPIALDACRSDIRPLFEAIACENPYPAACFPELNFNQMVLKALFTGIGLHRILDLDRRITPELIRMAEDYASERRAAGRPISADIGLLIQAKEVRHEAV